MSDREQFIHTCSVRIWSIDNARFATSFATPTHVALASNGKTNRSQLSNICIVESVVVIFILKQRNGYKMQCNASNQ